MGVWTVDVPSKFCRTDAYVGRTFLNVNSAPRYTVPLQTEG